MSIIISRDFESKNYFMNVFNSNNVLLTRIPVEKELASMSELDRYKYLKENHPDIYKRIR